MHSTPISMATPKLAIIATKPKTVPEIVEQCGRSGIKIVIILTAGFAESGHAGAALERKTLEIARSYGVRVLGPNCIGVIRPELGLNATYGRVGADVGNLAHLCQRHHSMKQFTPWKVRQLPGGVLEWTSPLGRCYTDASPRRVMFV